MFGIGTVSFEMVHGHIHLHIFVNAKCCNFPKNDYDLSKAFKFLNIIPLTAPPGMTVLNIGWGIHSVYVNLSIPEEKMQWIII